MQTDIFSQLDPETATQVDAFGGKDTVPGRVLLEEKQHTDSDGELFVLQLWENRQNEDFPYFVTYLYEENEVSKMLFKTRRKAFREYDRLVSSLKLSD